MEELKREILAYVQRAIRDATARINLAVDAGIAKLVKDDAGVVVMQVEQLAGELDDQVEYWQPSGLSFVPPVGSEVLFASVGGDRGHAVAVAVQKRDQRPKNCKPGEGGLHFLGEYKVFLDEDGNVCLGAKAPSDWVSAASKTDAAITAIRDALLNAVPGSMDGGAALLASIIAALEAAPFDTTASSKVKVEP